MPRYRAGRMEITICELSQQSISLRDFSNLFRSAANMSVFVVIRGNRNPTVAGCSIIEGKGCDVTFLAWCYGLPSFGIIGHSVEDLLNEKKKNEHHIVKT
jgi:hypothetical protein